MSWLERLKNLEKGPGEALTKLPKAPSVSFVSPSGGHIGNFSHPEPGIEPAGSWGELTDRQSEALVILRADPGLRRAFRGESTPEGYRLAVAIRKPDGKVIVGELVLPEAPPLTGLADAFRMEELAP